MLKGLINTPTWLFMFTLRILDTNRCPMQQRIPPPNKYSLSMSPEFLIKVARYYVKDWEHATYRRSIRNKAHKRKCHQYL